MTNYGEMTTGFSNRHLFQRIQEAFQQGDYHLVIEIITCAINLYAQEDLILLYNLRATAYDKAGKLELALADVQRNILHMPHESNSYLHSGKLYHMHGYQNQALCTLNQGLTVVPTSDHNYLKLKEAQTTAAFKASQRINMITILPFELLLYITSMLSWETRIACLFVSKMWCIRLISCTDVWKNCYLGNPTVLTAKMIATAVSTFGCHIQTLTLDRVEYIIQADFIRAVSFGKFSKITSLTLEGWHPSLYDALPRMLFNVGETLVSFTLRGSKGLASQKSIPCQDILNACPQLTTATFESKLWDDDRASLSIPLRKDLHLITLKLLGGACDDEYLQKLLDHCPKLHTLSVEGPDLRMIRATISPHFGHIKELDVRIVPHTLSVRRLQQIYDRGNEEQIGKIGPTFLSIQCCSMTNMAEEEVTEVLRLLRIHMMTIQELFLYMPPILENRGIGVLRTRTVQLPNLTVLKGNIKAKHIFYLICAILRGCPQLRICVLRFTYLHSYLKDEDLNALWEALQGRPLCTFDLEEHPPQLLQFLTAHASLRSRCTLRVVKLSKFEIDEQLLSVLGDITTLHEIAFTFGKSIQKQAICNFIEKIGNHNSLTTLSLTERMNESLILSDAMIIRSTIDNCPSLKNLYLNSSAKIQLSDNHIRYAQDSLVSFTIRKEKLELMM